MRPLKIFIDTEFTSFENLQLISLGLASENGEEVYFEVEYDKARCSDFVRQNVLPLLSNDSTVRFDRATLPLKISEWLQIVKEKNQLIELCHDDDIDWRMFEVIMNGTPDWIIPRSVFYELSPLLLEEYYAKNNLPKHHALYDARANAYAFREKK